MNDQKVANLERMIADDERIIHELNTKLKIRDQIIQELIKCMVDQANAQINSTCELASFLNATTTKMVLRLNNLTKQGL